MSLPERPGLMHALPLVDLLALVMLFPLLSTSLAPQAGVEVELPETDFRLQRVANPIVVSITGGVDPQFWVGKELVEEDDLLALVQKRAESWESGGAPAVLMRVDKSAQMHGVNVMLKLKSEGFRCLLAAKPIQ
ncbi:MAG: biopolymer transporter ExbD [Rubritalea sp.]|uniref:ExbD/TolR family protein n=1 Tax=Rubritalea sp. TaxID=2109375 RepID=UPI003242EA7B